MGMIQLGEIQMAGHRLRDSHLQDAERDGPEDRHWVPTHGDLDWEAIVATLFQATYTGTWTFEVHKGRHGETAEEASRLCLRIARQ
jgi:sugar phosphate isomerase/epimerase